MSDPSINFVDGVNWVQGSSNDDAIDAARYMSLIRKSRKAKKLAKKLSNAPIKMFKAKDILRAAQLQALPIDNPDVAAKLAIIAAGTPLPPVYLIRGNVLKGRPLTIADGYHRVSAVYQTDETADVPCQIINPG